MIRILQLHRKADSTINADVTAVELLAKHYNRSPDQIFSAKCVILSIT